MFNKFNLKFEISYVLLYFMDIMVLVIIGGMVIIGIIIGLFGFVLLMRCYFKI